MKAQALPGGNKAEASIYHLKLVLRGTEPPVWRRLQVPGNANLGWLHAVIQVAVGWTNSHLHRFKVGGAFYSDPRQDSAEAEGGPAGLDESRVTLQQLAPRVKNTLVYEYDFGDSWEHRITVEKILPPAPTAATVAQCLAGARACPPEDCGGVGGYDNLLKIIKNPKHAEHASIMEWLGAGFDPEAYDADEANTYLRKLKWPHVTEDQLRQVLMARDDYRK